MTDNQPDDVERLLKRWHDECWQDWYAVERVVHGEDPWWVCVEVGIYVERED